MTRPPSSPFLLLLPLLLSLSLPSTAQVNEDETPFLDGAEYFGFRMGQGPFCDSFCMPNGGWEYRRDWVLGDLDNYGRESTFIWAVDGDASYWSERCGARVNDMIFGNRDPNTFILQSCFPGIIYMFEYVVEFENDEGLLTEKLTLSGSYTPTQEAWDEFVQLVGERISPNFVDSEIYTLPWSLFRIMPSLEGASFTDSYDGDVFTKTTWITTYERNCCTFVGSVLPIETSEYCNFDEDLSSDQAEYVSYLFCEYFFDSAVVDDYYIGCGDTEDSENCNAVYVGVNGGESREIRDGLMPKEPRKRMWEVIGILRSDDKLEMEREAEERDTVEPGAKRSIARELMATVGNGAKVEMKRKPGAGGKKYNWFVDQQRHPTKRGTYAYEQQPIEAIGQDQGPFYYVPYTSSIVAPYCGYRRAGGNEFD